MNTIRLQVNKKTIYEGPAIAVPRVGDQIHHDGYVSHILSVEWDFSADDPESNYAATVSVTVGNMAYTY
jgi:hypothetical protein